MPIPRNNKCSKHPRTVICGVCKRCYRCCLREYPTVRAGWKRKGAER